MGVCYQHEAHKDTHVPFTRDELRSLQENGDIRKYVLWHRGSPVLTLHPQRAKPASKREMSQFHSEAYIEFLHRITPEHVRKGTSKVSAPPGDRTAEVYDCIRASLHPAPLFSVAATQACHDIRRRRNLDAGARPMPEVEVSPFVFLQHWQDNISV